MLYMHRTTDCNLPTEKKDAITIINKTTEWLTSNEWECLAASGPNLALGRPKNCRKKLGERTLPTLWANIFLKSNTRL